MNKTSIIALSKFIGILLVLMGAVFATAGIAGLLGSTVAGIGASMATSIGKGPIDFPLAYGMFGGLLITAFGSLIVALGMGLFQLKKWSPNLLIAFAVINFVSSIGTSPQAFTTMFFSAIMIWLGVTLKSQKPSLLK